MSAEIVKICKVHGELTAEQIYLGRRKYKECKICMKDRINIIRKKYKHSKEKNTARMKKYRNKNSKKVNMKARAYARMERQTLSDSYIKKVINELTGIPFSEISYGEIISKRLSMIANRLYKQHMKGEI